MVKNNTILKMACKCKICGRSLRGVFIRYGGQSCAACASFFVRSLEKKNMDYFCGNNDMCLTFPSVEGAQCQKCRFQKCIEIGMSCSALDRYINKTEAEAESNAEYIILAKRLNALLTTCTEYPQLLLNHLVMGDVELLEKSRSAPEMAGDKGAFLKPWAKIFQTNKIEASQIHILFYSIVCNIQFPWLCTVDQDLLFEAQQKSIAQHLQQPNTYSSEEMKEGFEKLTSFFQNQYHKYFATPKLQTTST